MRKSDSQSRALFVIESDPESSPRAAEAVRIAAGLGAWKEIGIDLWLKGAGAKALSPYPEELIDGNIFRDYLPTIAELGGAIFVDGAEVQEAEAGRPFKIRAIDSNKIASTLRRYSYLFHF
ncbi:MAG: hypothetical protein ACO1QB_07565 [Verrucomicrobiales bacterium]